MYVPDREKAFLPSRKLTDYLLSPTHAVGRTKARFFHAQGFDQTNADELAQNLIAIVHQQPVVKTIESIYGTKYIVDGPLMSPSGATVLIRTVWIIEKNDDRPRFVTAYPL